MAALKLDMTIPLADTGHITLTIDITSITTLTIDITSITTLTADDRAFLADTVAEFCTFASRTLAPPPGPGLNELRGQLADKPPAAVHDPNGAVIAGVTGSRIRTDL